MIIEQDPIHGLPQDIDPDIYTAPCLTNRYMK
jgi:hypothetical protein